MDGEDSGDTIQHLADPAENIAGMATRRRSSCNSIDTHSNLVFDSQTHAIEDDISQLDLVDNDYDLIVPHSVDSDIHENGYGDSNFSINDENISNTCAQSNNSNNKINYQDENGDIIEDEMIDENGNESEEFPLGFIDKDEMMETSDDQDILGSPHSSFSYDDTLSDQKIDGLTNYNIILEYPQLTFEGIQLLPFNEELNDWFSYKDLKHLDTISKLSDNITANDLTDLGNTLQQLYSNDKLLHQGKILEILLKLTYIIMGCFNNASSKLQIKETMFSNIKELIKHGQILDIVIDIVSANAITLTDVLNLKSNVNILKLHVLSNQFYFGLTILYIILLSFNTEELNDYELKKKVSLILETKNILIVLLKSVDRWKWISINSDTDDPSIILESMTSKVNDNEKRQILAVTQFKIRNVIGIFNQLIIFLFGGSQHIQSTKEFLSYKFEESNKTYTDDLPKYGTKSAPNNVANSDKMNNENESENENEHGSENENENDYDYAISSIDYEYYINELMLRYPTYAPPKYETSEIVEMSIKNENRESISDLINVDALLVNQHQHLRSSKQLFSDSNEPPDVHIATPMPSPTLTPQHTGNSRNYSQISEYEHTSNEIKKKLYITQSNYPNIYPSNDNAPNSIKNASKILFDHIKDDFNTKQFISIFEKFIIKEKGFDKNVQQENKNGNYVFTENDFKENPLFEDEIHSLQNVENFYKDGLPYFNSLIFIILKLLVSNIIPSQQSSENGKTRQRTPYKHSERDNKPYMSNKLSMSEKQKLEINRMKEVMLKNGSSILILIQKWFKLSHILKFEFFTTLLFDQDYLIYLFRYLDSNKIQANANKDFDLKDTKNLINNRIVYCDYKVLYYLEDYNFFLKCLKLSRNENKEKEEFDEQKEFDSIFDMKLDENENNMNPLSFILPFVPQQQIFRIINPNVRCCILMSNLLESMYYNISQFKIQRIYKLIGIRPTEILRFYLTLHNELFYKPILETIKMISPFIGKKWRANNMDLISFVYLFSKIGLKDPWLNNYFNVGIEENTKRGYDNEVALRSMIKFYNFEYYGDKLRENGFGVDIEDFMNEVERYNGDFFKKEFHDL